MRSQRWSRFFVLAALLFVVVQPALALSDAEYKALLAESQEFREADEGLNGAWKEAKKTLLPEEFKALAAEQAEWLKAGRDELARFFAKNGSTLAQSYAEATSERIAEINAKISRSVLKRSPKGAQGYYSRSDGDMTGILEVWWYDESTDEHYVAFENRKGHDGAESCVFAAKGSLVGNTLVAFGQEDDNLSVTIVFDGNTATVTASELFKKSGWCSEGVVLDGVYAR